MRHGDAPGIDRSRPIGFSFNGRRLRGYEGDTLASALLANDINVVSRSLKFHRPRGILSAGTEEAHALVALEGDDGQPSVMATQVVLSEGLSAVTQNAWPGAGFDVGAVLGWFHALMPAGFYYKTFMWPSWRWYEPLVRRLAGLGTMVPAAPTDRYSKRYAHCETLIVGAGPAGLAAALSLRGRGGRIIVLDAGPQPGGTLLWERDTIEGVPARSWLARSIAMLEQAPDVRLLRHTTAIGCHDHNMVSAVECGSGDSDRRGRLWRIRAARVVLATGAHERPLVFPDNDRPGIILASAVRRYLNEYGVMAGRRVVVYTNNDSAYRTAMDLRDQGTDVVAVVDVRARARGGWVDKAVGLGIRVLSGHAVVSTKGNRRVSAVTVAPIDEQGRPDLSAASRMDCDLVAMSGGWSPAIHLWSHAGGGQRYDEKRVCIVPEAATSTMAVVGSANGSFGLSACLAEGAAQGPGAAPRADDSPETPPRAYWMVPGISPDRQWIDFLHDATAADIEIAIREGFTSVEHLKRYTTIGMSIDQGKTSNVNALAILGAMSSRAPGVVGTTRSRPPYEPVAFGALVGARTDALATRYRRLPVTWHEGHGAVMENHGGWLRPAYYATPGEHEAAAIVREVRAAREGVVLFDSSSLGKLIVRGRDAATFLTRCYVNNVRSLAVGRARYGLMLNDKGVIADDGVFARLAPNDYLVMTSSSGALDTIHRLEEYLQCEWRDLDVSLTPVTDQWATLALSGPRARSVLQRCRVDLAWGPDELPHLGTASGSIEGIPLRLCRVSFTGESCFELSVPADFADALWCRLLDIGHDANIVPLGMEALNVLRVEKGFLEVGVDTDVDTTPLDVGWAAAIAKKGEDFIGRRSLYLPALARTERMQVVGFVAEASDREVPVGTHVLNESGRVQGHITSSCLSPTLDMSVGMALVRGGFGRLGARLTADVDGQPRAITLTAAAHYDPDGRRLHG